MKIKANGKLLLTAEYMVLLGAKALALPTKVGQVFQVFPLRSAGISWKSYDEKGAVWINEQLSYEEIYSFSEEVLENSPKTRLLQVLHEAHKLNSTILTQGKGYLVESTLEFPKKWGLGTSSTLLYFIAKWFEIDAYQLLEKTFGGSGYDIACAGVSHPIFYTKNTPPKIEKVEFKPHFQENLYFLYLNQKKNSREAIESFKAKTSNVFSETIEEFSQITEKIAKASTFEQFCELINLHENKLSQLLEIPTIKQELFSDFQGSIKSLGGWGGDFVLVASKTCPKAYFSAKGYDTLLRFEEMFD
ncbi:GYDIA family GHMP kinase [Capnocytophaga sp. ARDL2]|uniref:GYDIA family GHMP kinase n=1 Tax=Capnocytophaga sp. ARDL2 TaxID=3238809 RepID=UPI003557DC3E